MMEILSFEEQAELEFIHRNEIISDLISANKLERKGLIKKTDDWEATLTEKGLFWIDVLDY